MLTIEFVLDEDYYRSGVERTMRDDVRLGLADAVNAVADLVRRRLERATRQVFSSPNPFTQHAFGTLRARPGDEDPAAAVFVYPQQALYLALEIFGGTRQAGNNATVLGGVLISGHNAPVDGYGNLPRSFLAEAAADPRDAWVRLKNNAIEVLVRHKQGGQLSFLAEVLPKAHYDPWLDFFGLACEPTPNFDPTPYPGQAAVIFNGETMLGWGHDRRRS